MDPFVGGTADDLVLAKGPPSNSFTLTTGGRVFEYTQRQTVTSEGDAYPIGGPVFVGDRRGGGWMLPPVYHRVPVTDHGGVLLQDPGADFARQQRRKLVGGRQRLLLTACGNHRGLGYPSPFNRERFLGPTETMLDRDTVLASRRVGNDEVKLFRGPGD